MTQRTASPVTSTPPSSNPFDAVWRQWPGTEQIVQEISRHADGRWRFLNALLRHIEARHYTRILEVGCGTAIDAHLLAIRLPSGTVMAVDRSWEAMRIARRVGEFTRPISLYTADALALPFADNSFDLIYSQGLLEHFPDPRTALSEAMRVVRAGGLVVVNVPQRFTGYTLWKHWQMWRGRWEFGWETEFSARQLLRLGETIGLRPREIFGYQHWRSWGEPAWVLRDLTGKMARRRPFSQWTWVEQLDTLYTRAWEILEHRYGQHFLQNLVVVFEK